MRTIRRVGIVVAGLVALMCAASPTYADDASGEPLDHTNQDGPQPRRTRSDHNASNDGSGAGGSLPRDRWTLIPDARGDHAWLERHVAISDDEMLTPFGFGVVSDMLASPQAATGADDSGSPPVPEPGAAALMLTGACALLRRTRSRG
ncbi:MAG: PEP-CTERM sorting domain-containing protein [Phycisphaerales bacterium]|nr:PEP-CTERM sorting domain-containing protein [Phycisphaerales bacterium]